MPILYARKELAVEGFKIIKAPFDVIA